MLTNPLQGKAQIKATTPFVNVNMIYDFLDLGVTRFGIGVGEMTDYYAIIEKDFQEGRQK